jgi:hypothetical protein
MKRIEIMPGARFGKLVVSGPSTFKAKNRKLYFECLCDCGNTATVRSDHLRLKKISGCGCARTTHGEGGVRRRTPEYKTWCSMLERCRKPQHRGYKNYGGRGITVCDRWIRFENFLADMGRRPPGTSLDRIDNNAGYDKENCRWATLYEQQGNKRNCVKLIHDGRAMNISDWARLTGIEKHTLGNRLRSGWSVSEALTIPIGVKRQSVWALGPKP